MPKLGQPRRAIAMAAATLTLAAGTALGVGGTAQAAAACTGWERIGTDGTYTYAGTFAGTVQQYWDSCAAAGQADLAAEFIWAPGFSGSVRLYIGDPWGPTLSTTYDMSGGNGSHSVFFAPVNHGAVSPNDAWRAGAEINDSQCVQWTSLHYYGNGSEWAGPYGGCGDLTAP
ncbi:hypothetical protein [Kitasatospora viridis]|uniref:Secreted protein n=1 Tax=Kitasatospora viridis TaxID=281105 RepID=A0A561SEU4_9ACTN|nr:hypothetical protein [Kitasatospora viridis]TWF73386.1 hypothetical protein FHX73_16537 [Kitasatospora viridis]